MKRYLSAIVAALVGLALGYALGIRAPMPTEPRNDYDPAMPRAWWQDAPPPDYHGLYQNRNPLIHPDSGKGKP